MEEKNIYFQLAPPGMHRCNALDRSIIKFKYHFIAGLCATDPDFPMQNWGRLIKQEEITLKLLRPSSLIPIMLSYAKLNG